MLKYLIKFVSQEKYADELMNGKLFMRCAQYYHDLERRHGAGQGDLREGVIFPGHAIYKNTSIPIFCLYSVDETDIVEDMIHIPNKVIKDFGCEQGFLVLIDFDGFEEALTSCDTHGYALKGGRVTYGTPSMSLSQYFLTDDHQALNLLVKSEYFSYQKEYRIIVCQQLPLCYHMEVLDGIDVKVIDSDQMKITYLIPGGLHSISRKIAVNNLIHTDTEYQLQIFHTNTHLSHELPDRKGEKCSNRPD